MGPDDHRDAPDGRAGGYLHRDDHALGRLTRLLVTVGVLPVIALVAGATASATSVSFSVTQPDDSVGVRLLDAPAERRADPRAQLYIVDHLNPGESIARRIEVTNTTEESLAVQLYAAGAQLDDGAFVFDGREGNELTAWTRVEPPVVTVAPDGAEVATVHITVPADAREGERYAVVWAEPPASTGGDVSIINRVGIRIYLSVGPGGEPASTFTITEMRGSRDEAGAPRVTASVRNTGGRALDIGGELMMGGGPGGISAGPFETPSATTVGVGESGEVTFLLDPALPAGPWDADVTLRSGTAEESANARILFPEAGEGTAVATERSPATGIIATAGLLLLLLVLLLLFLARRRKKKDQEEEASGPEQEPSAPMP